MSKSKKRRIRKQKKKSFLKKILALFLVVATIVALVYFRTSFKGNSVGRIAQERSSLQMEAYIPGKETTPSPTPTPRPSTPISNPPAKTTTVACNHDNGQPAQVNDGKPVSDPTCFCPAILVECKDKKCVRVVSLGGRETGMECSYGAGFLNAEGKSLPDMYCAHEHLAPTDGTFCIGKPVIYLYPTSPISIDVEVRTDGDVFISDPQIERGNKWTNVWAEPNGRLTYNGAFYRELFYESNVLNIRKPTKGLSLDINNIETELDHTITKLGLIGDEKAEFLEYWIPRLEGLKSKYVFFGIVEKDEKDRIDKVVINPKPDTMIEFIVYFAPLDKPYEGLHLELPATPQRVGFTAVEWGGVIGK